MYQLKNYLYWENFHSLVRYDRHDLSNNSSEPHSHADFYEMVVVREGSASHYQDARTTGVTPGSVLLIRPGECHGYRRPRELGIYNILFAPSFLSEFQHDLSATGNYQLLFGLPGGGDGIPVLRLDSTRLAKAVALLEEIIAEESRDLPGSRTAVKSALLQLLLLICRHAEPHEEAFAAGNHAFPISRVMAALEERYPELWTLERMARFAGMSQSSFRQQFRQLTGFAPMAHLLQLRLRKAAALLQISDQNIGEIATDCGFPDSNYFSRAFRAFFGQSPREYRARFASRPYFVPLPHQ